LGKDMGLDCQRDTSFSQEINNDAGEMGSIVSSEKKSILL
jgi:hypothetical protein